ncbi:MAG: hypothetical protein NTZ74_07010 [Chloroflexi bacterium]|nr:hypothetical protein [Chloroflexota bacterium]
MNVKEIMEHLDLNVFTSAIDFSKITPSCAYASDLLSCVMAGAHHQSIWITLQAHSNIVAVATLLELSAIIITEGATPDLATITKANEEGVTLLGTNKTTFFITGKLWELGVRCDPKTD